MPSSKSFDGKVDQALRGLEREYGRWARSRRMDPPGSRISRAQRNAAMSPHIWTLAQAATIDPDRFEPRVPAGWVVAEIRRARAARNDPRVVEAA